MSDSPPIEDRINREWTAVKMLASEARFWNAERVAEPTEETTEHWKLTFSANFIAKVKTASRWNNDSNRNSDPNQSSTQAHTDVVEIGDELAANVMFPRSYPKSPPTIHLETPVFHPNIAADGIVNLVDIGIVWSAEVTMDLVIERFWNVIRGSYMNDDHPIHVGAGQWFKRQTELTLPIDDRPLTEDSAVNHNIVSYRRKGESFRKGETFKKRQAGSSLDRPSNDSDSSSQRHLILDEDETNSSGNEAIHFID